MASSTISPTQSGSGPLPAGPTKPPRSKTQPYYSISPMWTDVKPIHQIDLEDPNLKIPGLSPHAGPALATISYTPRYAEAMSYLRAVMADNEFSERVLALTEDVIGMNPAHYTVWLYRFRVLKEMWGLVGEELEEENVVSEEVIDGVQSELVWLKDVSEKHLKNYQIWHHRQSLVALLPTLPPNELLFLRTILSLDTKNYHVWSYRQWLCTRYPDPLLTTEVEVDNTDQMISEDVHNNSAWNHRYFVIFGHKELAEIEARRKSSAGTATETGLRGRNFRMEVVDLELVDRELAYAQERIRWAPQNGSAWNYLKGVLRHAGHPLADVKEFCGEFVGAGYDLDAEGSEGVRSSHAVEMLIEIFAKEVDDGEKGVEGAGSSVNEAKDKVRQGLTSLAGKWDPIRKKYWDYRLKTYEALWESKS